MKVIEHRRHAKRAKPGKHLAQEGVDMARRLGDEIGSFDLVVTSDKPRAIETAIAMGFAPTETVDDLSDFTAELTRETEWDAGFAEMARVVGNRPNSPASGVAQKHASIVEEIAERLPEDGRALVISHGGIVEIGTVAALPGHDFSEWDYALGFCEGVRLSYQDGAFVGAELLTVAGAG